VPVTPPVGAGSLRFDPAVLGIRPYMARKKSKADQATIAVNRLVSDEEVQKQLRMASLKLREAWSRASRRPASKAVEDKKIYDKVRDAAGSLVHAGRLMRKQPEPPKHTGRKIAVGAAVAGGAAFAVKKKLSGNGIQPEPPAYVPPTPVPTPQQPVAAA
jgi:hypothetical protein